MSVVRDRLNSMKGNKMNKLEKLDLALRLLKDGMRSDLAYAMMYGYLAVVVSEDKADEVLKLVQERIVK
jgi:predicted Zn-dependent protease